MRSNFKVLKSWAPKTTSINVQYDAGQTEHYVQLSDKNMQTGGCLNPRLLHTALDTIPGSEG